MGSLTPRPRERGRGQLIVVTALALAVLLSLLALALNTAVFGGIHVAQSDDNFRSEYGAVEYQDAVERGTKGMIPIVNAQHGTYVGLDRGLDRAVANWSAVSRPAYARDAAATNASVTKVAFETRVVQNASDDFAAKNGSTAWTVAGNTPNVSGYGMNVSDANLVTTADCTGGDGCFVLTVDGTNATWRMYVHTTATASVAIKVDAGGSTETCETSASPVRIDVTNGTFDEGGVGCAFTTYQETAGVDPPYTVTYANAGNVSGTYELTAASRLADNITDDGRYGTTGSPRLEPRIRGATVHVRYRSADLTYRTEVRVRVEGEGDD